RYQASYEEADVVDLGCDARLAMKKRTFRGLSALSPAARKREKSSRWEDHGRGASARRWKGSNTEEKGRLMIDGRLA
ncbi:hypothetical protein BHE74_00039575, partial [Ensete ventricosum]